MKGKLEGDGKSWYVTRMEEGDWKTYYPLHLDDVKKINEHSIVFDNIEARIAANPDVEFEIVDVRVLEGVKKFAKLI